MSTRPEHDDVRSALQRQLEIPWGFARAFVLGRIDQDLALWQPAPTSATVRFTGTGWVADRIDEDTATQVAPPTIGWLLWHIEWWWTNTLATIEGEPETPHQDFRWSGGTDHLAELKRRWDTVLAEEDPGRLFRWVMPDPYPLSYIAGWVTFELTKNLAEINQLTMLRASRS